MASIQFYFSFKTFKKIGDFCLSSVIKTGIVLSFRNCKLSRMLFFDMSFIIEEKKNTVSKLKIF